MLVAYTLGKTMQEIANMPLTEVNDWLAFINVHNERENKEIERAMRKKSRERG